MLTWESPSPPPDAELSRLAREVLTHGRAQAEGGNALPIACLVRDGEELVAGGSGRTEFNRLFVSYLWVSEASRRQGIGSEILRRLEAQASDTGCTSALIETLSDEAARLYARAGYEAVAIIPNYVGHFTRHVMLKSLVTQRARSEA
jgi:ribosomal protein S18 acetylase RimI-like enzyme